MNDKLGCNASVATPGLRMNYHRCARPVVDNGKCKIHCADAVARRAAKSAATYKVSFERSPFGLLKKAEDEIASLRAQVEEMREALEPFRKHYDKRYNLISQLAEHALVAGIGITVGDLRRAASVLASTSMEDKT